MAIHIVTESAALKAHAREAVSTYRERATLIYRTVTELAVLAILDAAHTLEADIQTARTADEAILIRRRLVAVRARVEHLDTLALARVAELGGGR